MRLRSPIPTIVAALLLGVSAAAGSAVPVVYEDNHITIRSGLNEVGLQPLHLGDIVSLVVAVEFDGETVRIENLDDAWLQRTFNDVAAIRLRDSEQKALVTLADGRVRIATHWRLQFLGCPNAAPPCAGSKSYALPVAAVAYQLTGSGSGDPDSRSARFQPWPGTAVLGSALPLTPGPDVELVDVFPGGAYAQPISVEPPATSGPVLLLAGAALLGAGLVASRRPRRSQPIPMRAHRDRRRWESAMAVLATDDLDDDEWSDVLRRSLTWYCLDELSSNPFAWLTSADASSGSETESARALFLDIVQQERIDPGRRTEFLGRLEAVTQTNVAAAGRGP